MYGVLILTVWTASCDTSLHFSLTRYACRLLAAWKPNNLAYQDCTQFEDIRLIHINKHTFPKVISFVELSAFLVT